MKIMSRLRGTGKTTLLVESTLKNPKGVLIVHSEQRRADLECEHPALRGRIFTPYNTDSLRGRDANVYIDELDKVLHGLLRTPVVEATITEF